LWAGFCATSLAMYLVVFGRVFGLVPPGLVRHAIAVVVVLRAGAVVQVLRQALRSG
jgi:hypothetical protein